MHHGRRCTPAYRHKHMSRRLQQPDCLPLCDSSLFPSLCLDSRMSLRLTPQGHRRTIRLLHWSVEKTSDAYLIFVFCCPDSWERHLVERRIRPGTSSDGHRGPKGVLGGAGPFLPFCRLWLSVRLCLCFCLFPRALASLRPTLSILLSVGSSRAQARSNSPGGRHMNPSLSPLLKPAER